MNTTEPRIKERVDQSTQGDLDATVGPEALPVPPQAATAVALTAAIDGITRVDDQRLEAQLYSREWGAWENTVLSLRRSATTETDPILRQRLESVYEGLLSALVRSKRRGRIRDSILFSTLATMFGVVEAEQLAEGAEAAVTRPATAIEALAQRIVALLQRTPHTRTHVPTPEGEDAGLGDASPAQSNLRTAIRRRLGTLARSRHLGGHRARR